MWKMVDVRAMKNILYYRQTKIFITPPKNFEPARPWVQQNRKKSFFSCTPPMFHSLINKYASIEGSSQTGFLTAISNKNFYRALEQSICRNVLDQAKQKKTMETREQVKYRVRVRTWVLSDHLRTTYIHLTDIPLEFNTFCLWLSSLKIITTHIWWSIKVQWNIEQSI
jgi:hypothetical protein